MIACVCLAMLTVGALLVSPHPARHSAATRIADLTGTVTQTVVAADRWPVRVLELVTKRRRARAAARPDAASLAGVLDRVARRCAGGDSLAVSLEAALTDQTTVGATSVLGPAHSCLAGGGTVVDALATVATEQPDVALSIHALRLCAEQGGNVVESLDRAAAALRERHGVRLERHAQSAQARLSAQVLTLVPIAFAGWTVATTHSVQQFVVTPPGIVCVGLGLTSNVVGWRLMARITEGAV